MTRDFSSSSNDSYDIPLFMQCFLSRPSSSVFTAYSIVNVLIFLPICIFILKVALHRWRSPSSVAAGYNSDCFIYNMVIMELISVVGSVLCCYAIYSIHLPILNVGCLIFSFSWYGKAMYHILMSLEGYLATVHPITYKSLGKERRMQFRNAEIVCNWLLSFAGMSLVMYDCSFIIMDFVLLMLSFTVIFFCSLSVVWVLIRPGTGEEGFVRNRFDQLKRKALFSIIVMLEVLLLRFVWNLAWVVMFLSGTPECLVLIGCTFSSLPSSLVLPLLFLRRERKLVFCSSNSE